MASTAVELLRPIRERMKAALTKEAIDALRTDYLRRCGDLPADPEADEFFRTQAEGHVTIAKWHVCADGDTSGATSMNQRRYARLYRARSDPRDAHPGRGGEQ